MIHLNKNSSTPNQKIDLENSLQQFFATSLKLLTFRYIYATSEGRGYSRNFALNKIMELVSVIYGSSQPLKAHFSLKSIYHLVCMRADQVIRFSMSS